MTHLLSPYKASVFGSASVAVGAGFRPLWEDDQGGIGR